MIQKTHIRTNATNAGTVLLLYDRYRAEIADSIQANISTAISPSRKIYYPVVYG